MGLKLLGKGSILDAIGGAAKTAVNAGIAGVKDVGDVADAGLNAVTGNAQGVQNATNAISSNDSDLSGESIGSNAASLGSDVAKPALGVASGLASPFESFGKVDIIDPTKQLVSQATGDQSAYNSENQQENQDLGLGTDNNLKRGLERLGSQGAQALGDVVAPGAAKGLETAAEGIIPDVVPKVLAEGTARAATGAGVLGGYNTASYVANDNDPTLKGAAESFGKGAEAGTVLGVAPSAVEGAISGAKYLKDNTTPLDEMGGINNTPVPAPGTEPDLAPDAEANVHAANPLAPTEAETNAADEMPEPGMSDLAASQAAADRLDESMNDPQIDWGKVQGANDELNTTVKQVAQEMKTQDLAARSQPTDLYKRIKAAGGIGSSDYEDMPLHLKRSAGMSMDRVAQELGYQDDGELHDAIQKEQDIRSGGKPTPKTAAEYREMAKQYIVQKAANPDDENALGFRDLVKRAQAEKDVQDYAKADQKSGYSKAKYQVPKGAPAKQFRQDLYEKTHSPEFQQRNDTGAQLNDVRQTMKGVKTLRDRAQKEYDSLQGRKGGITETDENGNTIKRAATADEIRGKAAELRSQEVRLRNLVTQERNLAALYRQHATDLDAKYPDTDLVVPKKGVRLVSNKQQIATTTPVETRPQAALQKAIEAAHNSGNKELEDMLTSRLDDQSMNPNATMSADRRAELMAKMHGGATETRAAEFTPTDPREMGRALGLTDEQMDAEEKAEAERQNPTRNVEGDRAILNGIKSGDSDASILQQYQDATGESLDQAKAAYGLMEDDPNVDKAGDVANNPHFGKHADYDIEDEAPSRGVRLRTVTAKANYLINKSLLRATAPGDQMVYKMTDANHLWEQLNDHDQELADQLRNHSISELADKADDRHDFQAYAMRAKDIEDYIHATRGIADPGDLTPYRQNYGAGFNLATEKGDTVSEMEALGQDPHALARHYSTYEELKDATGLDRATANFHEDLGNDVGRAQNSIANHSLVRGLNQAFGDGSASYGERTRVATTQLKDFPNVFADKRVADRINSRAAYEYNTDKIGSALKYADKTNSAMKNIKLSVGGFHNINEMLNQASLNPTGVGDASKALVNSDYFRARMNEWDHNGTMEKALHSGLTIGAGDEFKAGLNKLPVIHQAHEALFGRQIPFSKMQVFERYTKNLDLNNPEEYDQMRGVARGINNTFGGINRLVDGLNPVRMKQLSRAVLAEDYNEGQIRTLLTAFDPRKITTTEGRMARQVVAGRASILALPGVTQGIVTGKIGNNPEEIAKFVGNQLVNPTVQTPFKTKSGIPKQIDLVAGIVNKADRALAPVFNKNNPNKLSGAESELSGNLSPAASLAEEEKNNSDYYGNPMHGQGLNAAEDIGQLVNASAPIPFTPGARALEGTRFGKNEAVKIVSGGQSGISPAEAAIDTSGIGRVASNPNSPQMKILNSRQVEYMSLKTSADKQALTNIHPSWSGTTTAAEEKAIYANPNYEINKWNSLRENTPGSSVYSVLKKQDQVAQQNGEPGDPLLKLSSANYQTVTEYEFLKHSDEGTDASNTAAVMYSQNKAMIDKYEQDNTTYEGQMNALYAKTAGTKGDSSPVEAVGGAPQYTETPAQTQLSNQYFAMNDSNSTSQQRAQFLSNNPELNQLFTAQFNAENAIRKQQDEPLLKPYPQASSALNNWMNQYTAASKTQRTALRNANPTLYNQMSNYMGQVDQYQLAKTLGQTQLQGDNVNQAQLKEEYDLGQYDINKAAGADGNDTYSLDPQAAYATSQTSGAGSGAENLIQELENEDKARDVKNTVKYDYKPVKIRIKNSRSTYLKRVGVTYRSPGGPKVKVKYKSVPIK